MGILDIVTDADRPPGGPWLDSVTGWVRRCSGRDEVILAEVVTEAWSTVWCTAGAEERLWFKESPWANRAEGVRARRPGSGWPRRRSPRRSAGTATADGYSLEMAARPWRTATGSPVPLWPTSLGNYAELQLATIDHRDTLVAAGLPDQPPDQTPQLLSTCLAEMASVSVDDPRHLNHDEVEHLTTVGAEAVRNAASTLRQGSVPLAFDHNDLFPRNSYLPRESMLALAPGARNYRFFDFAESVWAHPFGSLAMLLWELVHRFDVAVGDVGPVDVSDSPIRPIFDSYLQCWRQFADLDQLRRLAASALLIAPLYRTATWLAVLRSNPEALDRHGSTPRAWIFDVTRPLIL